MLIPVGEDVAVPVTVVVLGTAPEVLRATLCRLEPDALLLQIPDQTVPDGTRVIITSGNRTKLPGRVLRTEAGCTFVSRDPAHPTDDRAAPRVHGEVLLRWRIAPNRRAQRIASQWLAGGEDPGPFLSFRGPADLSLSGIRFDCGDRLPPVGATVLLELGLDREDAEPATARHAPHRAIGAVRRVEPVREHNAVGIEFVDLPEATFDALSDYTLRNL